MKLKKHFCHLMICAMAFTGLAGCQFQTSKSLVFNVETGDRIEVKLDTTDKHSLSQEDSVFKVEKDDKVMAQGIFLSKDMFDAYLKNIHASKDATIIEDKLQEENGYLFYMAKENDNVEYDCIFMVKDTNTGILMGSIQSKEEAEEAFHKITIMKAED